MNYADKNWLGTHAARHKGKCKTDADEVWIIILIYWFWTKFKKSQMKCITNEEDYHW